MKVAIFNTSEGTGGAARAAWRLHRGLLGNGVDSTMVVQKKESGDPTVVALDGPAVKVATALVRKAERLATQKLFSNNPRAFIGINRFSFGTERLLRELNPDIVHLHWIGEGLFSVEKIGRLRQPVVWTVHDMWAFTGGCYYDEECGRFREACGRCPQLGSRRERDLTRWTWRRKQRHWRPERFAIVSPSRWLAQMARESSLFRDFRVEVIPNGLDLAKFKPLPRAFARLCLGLPPEKQLILFGARSSTDDPRKGFGFLRQALLELSAAGRLRNAEALIFGGPPPRAPIEAGLPCHFLGELRDETSLALVYAAADLFVAPSRQENLPNTIMEAMACGTPCVAFRIGGNSDMIEDGANGMLAAPFEVSQLAAGIDSLLADPARRESFGRAAREKAEREYELSRIAGRYAALYDSMRASG